MKISIVGSGYVGLVTGVGLAAFGHEVICVDNNKEKIQQINLGESPILEKGMDLLLKKVLNNGSFKATDNLKQAFFDSEVTFIAVQTPLGRNKKINLSYVKKVAGQIGFLLPFKKSYHTIVVKSTVVPETCIKEIIPVLEKSGKRIGEFGFCMNPEFLREGSALEDFINPDRIIIGEIDKRSGDVLAKVYKNFNTEILRTSLQNAEMIKYTSNAFFANLVSFSNEIADICERIPGANAFEVLKGLHLDKRLNPVINGKRLKPQVLNYILPGCGFGGSCLPKDLKSLIGFSLQKGYEPVLLSAVLRVNDMRAACALKLLEKNLGNIQNKKVAVLGLTFKPDTNDTRDSPSISIINLLNKKGAIVSAYDPALGKKDRDYFFYDLNTVLCNSLDEVLENKDACILVTSWAEFKKITPQLLKSKMKTPLFIDGRGFLNAKDFEGKIRYYRLGVGREEKNKQMLK